jgi:hypothetical protein
LSKTQMPSGSNHQDVSLHNEQYAKVARQDFGVTGALHTLSLATQLVVLAHHSCVNMMLLGAQLAPCLCLSVPTLQVRRPAALPPAVTAAARLCRSPA